MRINRQVILWSSALLLAAPILQTVSANASDEVNCEKAYSTHDMEYCAAQKRGSASKSMRQYLTASYNQYNHDPSTVEAIKASQQTWETYKNSNCDAVHTSWNTGSIRGLMSINCHTRMTKQRTHELWLNYLTYMDSTPPVLPEPLLN